MLFSTILRLSLVETIELFGSKTLHGIYEKVFKNGLSKISKGCLPQILLGLLLNAFSNICLPLYWEILFLEINSIKKKKLNFASFKYFSI